MNSEHQNTGAAPAVHEPESGFWSSGRRFLWSAGATATAFMSPFHSQTLFLKSLLFLLLGVVAGPGIALVTPALSKNGILPPLRDPRARQKLRDSLKTALIPALIFGILTAYPLFSCLTTLLHDSPEIIRYQERRTLLCSLAILTTVPGLVSGYLILELRDRLPWLSRKRLLSETARALGSNIFQLGFFIILLFWICNVLVITAELTYGILNDELLLKTYNMPEAVNLIPWPLWNGIFLAWFLGSLNAASRNVSLKLAGDAENSIRTEAGVPRKNAALLK